MGIRGRLLLTVGLAVSTAAACSIGGTAPPPSQPPAISITGAYVELQPTGNDPFVALTIKSSQANSLTSAKVDAKIATGVNLTAPTYLPNPTEGASPPAKVVLTPGSPQASVDLPAGTPVTFGPGSYGMFLTGAKVLKPGSLIDLTLSLESGDVKITAVVHKGN